MLRKELGIFCFKDLLEHYPLRHVDKTKVDNIQSLNYQTDYAQVAGRLIHMQIVGEKRSRRLIVHLQDNTGTIELVWFQGINWVEKMLVMGHNYLAFGKVGFFMNKPQMAHPEIETYNSQTAGGKAFLEPIYPSTEKLKAKGLTGKAFNKLTLELFSKISEKDLPENLPHQILDKYKLMKRFTAFQQIHLPINEQHYQQALRRLKFDEFFFAQFSIQLIKIKRNQFSKGLIFEKVGALFSTFYEKEMPFQLTNAQKNVLKEIRKDTASGHQMNRLLQGDVGSGKTMVALL